MGNASLTSMFDRSKFPSLLNVDVYSFKASDNGEKAQTIATSIAKKLGLLQTRAVAGFAPVQAYQTKKKKKEDQEGKAPATRSSVESVANSRRFSVSSPSSFSSSSSSSKSPASSPAIDASPSSSASSSAFGSSYLPNTFCEEGALFFRPDGRSVAKRRLHVEDTMELSFGDHILIIVCSNHPDFEKYRRISAGLSQLDGLSYSFQRGYRASAVQLMAQVQSDGKAGQQILRGGPVLSDAHRTHLFRTGAGFSFIFDEDSDRQSAGKEVKPQKTEIQYLDVLQGFGLEIWDLNPRGLPNRDYVTLFPSSGIGNPANFELVVDQLITEVNYDPNRSLALVAAFKGYSDKKQQLDNRKSSGKVSLAATDDLDPGLLSRSCKDEMTEKGLAYADTLEEKIKSAYNDHFNWTSPDSPIINWTEEFCLMAQAMPLHWAALSGTSTLRTDAKENVGVQRRHDAFRFNTICAAIRQRDSHKLSLFASLPAMKAEAKGEMETSSEFKRTMRFEVGQYSVTNFYNDNYEKAIEKQRVLLHAELVLLVGYDNFQQYFKKKTQRGGQSSEAQEGTARYAVRARVQLLPIGTVLASLGRDGGHPAGEYVIATSVMAADHFSCLYSISRINLGGGGGAAGDLEVALPAMGWTPKSVPGLQPHPEVTYVKQSMTMPRLMRTYIDPAFCRLLDGPPSESSSGLRNMTADEYRSELDVNDRLCDLRRFTSHDGLFLGAAPVGGQKLLVEVLNPLRSLLHLKGHQAAAVLQWNPSVGLASSVEILALSKFREVSKEEAANVVVELLVDSGFVEFKGNKRLQVGENADLRKIQFTGDRLTISQFNGMSRRLVSKLCDPRQASNARALLQVLSSAIGLPGDLHFLMHMLCAIFILAFGGFLQAFQAALRWKRIQLDPVGGGRFQQSRKLAVLVFVELKRILYQDWAAALVSVSIAGVEVLLKDLGKQPARVIVLALQDSFAAYIDEKTQSSDAVVAWVMQFYDLMTDFVRFDRSIKVGDSIAVELIMVAWLAVFALVGKIHYTALVACWLETAFQTMTPAELEEMRLNRFVLLTVGHGRMAKDDICEKINLFLKYMRDKRDMDLFVRRSVFLSWMRRCSNSLDDLHGTKRDKSSSVHSDQTPQMKVVYAMLRAAEVTVEKGRTDVPDDLIWGLVATYAQERSDEDDGDTAEVGSSAQAVNELFGKMARTAPISQEEVNAEVADAEPPIDDEEEEDAAATGATAAGDDNNNGGGAGGSESNVTTRRYPFSSRSMKGNWKSDAELGNYQSKREAERASEQREREQLSAAVDMHEQRARQMADSVDEIEARMMASTDVGAEAEQAAIPSWRVAYDAWVAKRDAASAAATATVAAEAADGGAAPMEGGDD
mmetsp:Transcript_90006/g.179697  ORF Transcript_90006/g.179697 Transcript_90006/m.179697 type:complete len:1367 (-) Transcript_90006:189-4289(-)